jgi:hypothetical protein
MSNEIKVGFCVAYDWYFLHHALPLIYSGADKIVLSLDNSKISWSNNQFDFDETAFRDFIKAIDKQNKIECFESDFHLSQLSPMENEVRQRNMMAEKLGSGGWHIQLDCDEYFIDFDRFVSYLKNLRIKEDRKVNICCTWVTLFKQITDGFLYILPGAKQKIEFIQVATNCPDYKYGRRNGHFNIYTNFSIIHQSWARRESEIKDKLNNWGHKNDFNADEYLLTWRSLTLENYNTLYNFHPTEPDVWHALDYVKGKSVLDFAQKFDATHFRLPYFKLKAKNSRLLSGAKQLLNIILQWISQ